MSSNYEDFKEKNAQFAASFKDGDKPLPPARKALLLTCMDGELGIEPPARPPERAGSSLGRLPPLPAGTPCQHTPAATLRPRVLPPCHPAWLLPSLMVSTFWRPTTPAARIHPEKALGVDIGDIHVVRNAGGRAADAIRSITISQQLLATEEVRRCLVALRSTCRSRCCTPHASAVLLADSVLSFTSSHPGGSAPPSLHLGPHLLRPPRVHVPRSPPHTHTHTTCRCMWCTTPTAAWSPSPASSCRAL